jgi:hypothetical protein
VLGGFVFGFGDAEAEGVGVDAGECAGVGFSRGGCDADGFFYQRCDFGVEFSLCYGHFVFPSCSLFECAKPVFIFDLSVVAVCWWRLGLACDFFL